ncbi:hypothetical protein MTYM_00044 [Methylococcales bacterium]|nr:hypothetical protein MTYM_00044 [Methylococcales bacterium]
MKAKLAMRLLADLMKWDETQATAEFCWLNMMAEAKYDHYHGYSPGSHFFANLLAWLGQFKEKDRATAYSLIRKRLVYVSQPEMYHLVNLTMPVIHEEMRCQVAEEFQIPYYKTWGFVEAEKRLSLMAIRTLYVGLSDGAKIDVFRRENEGHVSNEQIVAASEISETKWKKLVEELRKRLDETGLQSEKALFERICLIDDFTASGTTLIRKEGEVWKGKIPTFCGQNKDRIGDDKAIAEGCWIHAHHYLTTDNAFSKTTDTVQEYKQQHPVFKYKLTFSSVLSSDIVIDDTSDAELVTLLKEHYDTSIEDDIVGNQIWFGYKQGGLPLVLYHNTPNNSVAVLWASSTNKWKFPALKMKPLFSRKKRHIGHG